MTIRIEAGVIYVEGRCPLDDAERLFVAIREHPRAPVDIHLAERLHMAVAQILLALGPELRGRCADPFLDQHVLASARAG